MDDALVIYLGFFGLMIVGAIAFFVGKWTDIEWRAKFMKNTFKKEYFVLKIVSDDRNTIKSKLINPNKDGTIEIPGLLWHFNKDEIYRSVKEDFGVTYDLKNNEKVKIKDGFGIKNASVKFNEGVPTIYVDTRSIKPLDFRSNRTNINPEELSASLGAWVSNQINKGITDSMKILKQMQLFNYIQLGLLILIVCVAVTIMNNQGEQTKILNALNSKSTNPSGLPNGAVYQNGSIVIKQGTT